MSVFWFLRLFSGRVAFCFGRPSSEFVSLSDEVLSVISMYEGLNPGERVLSAEKLFFS